MKQRYSTKRSLLLQYGTVTVLLGFVVYVLVRHQTVLKQSFIVLGSANIGFVLAAIALTFLTFCIAALTYGILALHRLQYRNTVLIELASAFANRVLPSGLGGLGMHGAYLRRQKHTVAEMTAVVSLNNLLGIVAHLSLLFLTILLVPNALQQFQIPHIHIDWQYLPLVLIPVVAVNIFPSIRRRLASFLNNLFNSARLMRPKKLSLGLASSGLQTLAYTLVLFTCQRALGLHLGVLQAFIIFSLGILVGTATPTPGGLVGVEAGLFTGFIGYGVSSPMATAVILIYRLITYWLPLLPGFLALILARQHKFV